MDNTTASLSSQPKRIKNVKQAVISGASNGYVISTTREEDYGQDMHIAAHAGEVVAIIEAYFGKD